jgi:hypothetical protein
VRRSHDGLGAAADADPRLQAAMLDRRVYQLVGERRAQFTRPGDGFLRQERREQVELLLEELLVLVELEAEEGERLDEA